MSTYIISYQTSNIGAQLIALENAIRAYESWGRINSNTWAVLTDSTAVQIRDNLLQYLNANDRLMVVRSGTEAAWRNSMASSDWLKTNL